MAPLDDYVVLGGKGSAAMLVVHRHDRIPSLPAEVAHISYAELPTNRFSALKGESVLVLMPRRWAPIGGAKANAADSSASDDGLSDDYLTFLAQEISARALTVFVLVPRPIRGKDTSGTTETLTAGTVRLIERLLRREIGIELLDDAMTR